MSHKPKAPEASVLPDNTFLSALMLLIILATGTFGIVLGYPALSVIR